MAGSGALFAARRLLLATQVLLDLTQNGAGDFFAAREATEIRVAKVRDELRRARQRAARIFDEIELDLVALRPMPVRGDFAQHFFGDVSQPRILRDLVFL